MCTYRYKVKCNSTSQCYKAEYVQVTVTFLGGRRVKCIFLRVAVISSFFVYIFCNPKQMEWSSGCLNWRYMHGLLNFILPRSVTCFVGERVHLSLNEAIFWVVYSSCICSDNATLTFQECSGMSTKRKFRPRFLVEVRFYFPFFPSSFLEKIL